MKKKVSVVLTALCLAIISVFALAACAPRPVNEETRVNGFSFREYGDGYEVANYLGDETEIEIPDTYKDKSVIGIGARAFSNTKITGITIPDSITTIGPNAFESCKELEEINIPESVTSIGD